MKAPLTIDWTLSAEHAVAVIDFLDEWDKEKSPTVELQLGRLRTKLMYALVERSLEEYTKRLQAQRDAHREAIEREGPTRDRRPT